MSIPEIDALLALAVQYRQHRFREVRDFYTARIDRLLDLRLEVKP